MDAEFLDMLGATVTRKTVSATSAYGELTYTGTTTYPARISYSTTLVRTSDSEEKTSSAQIWVYGITNASLTDVWVLPDGSQRLTLRIEAPMDADGTVHHQKFYLE